MLKSLFINRVAVFLFCAIIVPVYASDRSLSDKETEILTDSDKRATERVSCRSPEEISVSMVLSPRDKVVFLPVRDNSVGPAVKGKGAIFYDGIEGIWPWDIWWTNWSAGKLEATWGQSSYRKASGEYSAWCVDSGNDAPEPGENVPSNVKAWMVAGPFDLSEATSGNLSFDVWSDAPGNYPNDYLGYFASLDGSNFSGRVLAESTTGFQRVTRDLTAFTTTLGDITGQPEVWFAWIYNSATDLYEGAYVDNILVDTDSGNIPGVYVLYADNDDNQWSGEADGDWGYCLFNYDLLHPIEFHFDIMETSIYSAQLMLLCYDVDEDSIPDNPEIDDVFFNGHYVGTLTGENNQESTSIFNIPPDLVNPGGRNQVRILVNQGFYASPEEWCVEVRRAQLTVNGASAGNVSCRYVTTGQEVYQWGDNLAVIYDLDTTLEGQEVRVETNIVAPGGNIIAGMEETRTIYGDETDPHLINLQLPNSGLNGPYTVQVLAFDAFTGAFETSCSTLISVGSGDILVFHDDAKRGSVFANSASQILPASYLTFKMDQDSLPTYALEEPVIIEISLPGGAYLGQTLATGNLETASPHPQAGETVPDLAVSEYSLSKSAGLPVAVDSAKDVAYMPPYAVQLLRYVTGESKIWIRINGGSEEWTPSEGDYVGFTIGLGNGVWPQNTVNNWGGQAGLFRQASTLFFADLRNFRFNEWEGLFPVSFHAFYQYNQQSADVTFNPSTPSLFTLDELIDGTAPVSSQVGGEIGDMALADLNGDGWDDLITVDMRTNRLYWTYGCPNGDFIGLEWLETVGIVPVTVDADDVSGDGRPDILIGDNTGSLRIYLWEDIFESKAPATKVARPSLIVKLPGVPVDSDLADINSDGVQDYMFIDGTDDVITILLGSGFSTSQTYAVGTSPTGVTSGDFNGDAALDIAVASSGSNTVTVLWNNGSGGFSAVELSGIGLGPIGIETADFNRDGKSDLAIGLSVDQALTVLYVQTNGQFDPAQRETIFFLNTPSALVADNFDALNGPDVLMGFSDFSKLSLCTSDTAGTLTFAFNIDTLGDVIVDPFNNIFLSEDDVLSVGAGTGFGGVSNRHGVAGIAQQGFNVLHFPRSSEISFSVVNLAQDDALLNLELYDDGGHHRTSTTVNVASQTQFANYLSTLLGPDANQAQRWVRAFSTKTETYGLWLVNNGINLDYLDGTRIPDVRDATSDFSFPVMDVAVGRSTTFFLINPNKASANAVLRLYGSDGVEMESYSALLPGRGRKVLDPMTIFSSAAENHSVRVQSDRGIVAVEIFGDSESAACLEGMKADASGGDLFSPHVAVGNLGVNYYSVLTLVNTGLTTIFPEIFLYDDSGVQQSGSQVVEIAANGKQILDVAVLFSLSGAFTGYLKIDAGGAAGIVGSITFGDADAGHFISSLPLQPAVNDDFILGHIANGTLDSISYFTGMAVLNTDDVSRTVTITAFNQFGVELASTDLNLGPDERRVFLLDQELTGLIDIFGGYILVDSPEGSKIIVFQLFGNATLDF